MSCSEEDILPETCAIIVMTRYPEPGQVKTRLIDSLGIEGSARLHQKMAQHTIATLEPLCDIKAVDMFVCFSGGTTDKMQAWLGRKLKYTPQIEGDLGVKMAHALEQVFNAGYDRSIILGTDCPDIDTTTIVKALKTLSGADVVLGPAKDGGYYLMGLSKPCRELFHDIDWGSDQVLSQTCRVAAMQNMNVEFLQTLRDIDTTEDLEWIKGTFLLP
ncbi:MAG: TIGR04282 family arsenosugar biosynthesis glycosyltransferase [Desulfuromonas sp.]|jgi:rSAM/selenodomain-associated transferase 1